jgi:predicted ATPase/DNA-binding SARP family transcriptional activator
MQYRILGPLEVEDDGGPVELGGPKQQALLACLLLHRNEVVPRERLIDELWGDPAPTSARHRLEAHVSLLRKTLGRNGQSPLLTRRGGYVVRVAESALDVDAYEELVMRARKALRSSDAERAARLFREGLALWRGQPLEAVAIDAATWPELRALEEQRVAAWEQLMEAELSRGRHDKIVAELERLVSEEPLRERFRSQLMLALYRSGRQADALAAYSDARRVLSEELGVEPGRTLKELEQAILRQDPLLDVFEADGRPLATLPRAPAGNLPRPATSLVGREREIEEVQSLVAGGARLVTLTGPGGSGKTRLALESSYRAVPHFPDGVFWVDLAPVRERRLVEDTIAHVVGAKGGVASHIGDRRVLLVVDNFEQVIDAGPDLASLVAACPELQLVVTSRERLHLTGETEFEVLPLGNSEAVELFCIRGRARPDDSVRELCGRLDNLPLAIEFAAARTAVLSPRQIVERLSQRLDLLKGHRDAESRQRTLRATIEWSHDLLSEEERRLFARLAVFTGGCTLEAAEEVAGADLDTLQSLVEKSLVQHVGERFSMLETIREYAVERLEETSEAEWLRRRHAAWFLLLAREAEAQLRAENDESSWLQRLDPEIHNLTSVLIWAQTGGSPGLELRLVAALNQFWLLRGRLEEGRTRTLEALGRARRVTGTLRARALGSASILLFKQGDFRGARELLEEAVPYYRQAGLAHRLCKDITMLMAIAGIEGDDELVRTLSDEQVSLRPQLGEAWAQVNATRLHNLGGIDLSRRRYDEAREELEAALALARANKWQRLTAYALSDLGFAALGQERGQDALRLFRDSLKRCSELGWPQNIIQCLIGLAGVSAAGDDLAQAARLLGAAENLATQTLAQQEPYVQAVQEAVASKLGAGLEMPLRQALLEEGRTMSLEEAVAFGLENARAE